MAYGVWADLVKAIGTEARLAQLTGESTGTHPNTTAELARFSDEVDGYLRKAGITLPLDGGALASPWNLDFVSLALPSIIKGDVIPQRYTDLATRAQKRFEALAAGRIEYPDPNAATAAGATSAPLSHNNEASGLDEDLWPVDYQTSL